VDPQKILNRWRNYFCQLFSVHGHGVRQTEMCAICARASASDVEVAIGKLKRYKSTSVDQNLAELIQAGGETFCLEIYKLMKLTWNEEELPHQLRESVVVLSTERVIKLTVIIIGAYHCCQLHTKFYQTFFFVG
jgi:hypothetical protein